MYQVRLKRKKLLTRVNGVINNAGHPPTYYLTYSTKHILALLLSHADREWKSLEKF